MNAKRLRKTHIILFAVEELLERLDSDARHGSLGRCSCCHRARYHPGRCTRIGAENDVALCERIQRAALALERLA